MKAYNDLSGSGPFEFPFFEKAPNEKLEGESFCNVMARSVGIHNVLMEL